MGKVRECFVCEMYLTLLERQTVEATCSGGEPVVVEVCARCYLRVATGTTICVPKKGVGHVVRQAVAQRDLFPIAGTSDQRKRGHHG